VLLLDQPEREPAAEAPDQRRERAVAAVVDDDDFEALAGVVELFEGGKATGQGLLPVPSRDDQGTERLELDAQGCSRSARRSRASR
jgi:hypothetical protein